MRKTRRFTVTLAALGALGACEAAGTPEEELPPEVNIEDGQIDTDSVDVDSADLRDADVQRDSVR